MLVLVADDHPLVREGLRRLLFRAGFEVVEAENGEEAIRKAEELGPSLVLWDLLMPGGGLEGLRRLREKVPEAKILVLTALDTPGLGEEVLRAGAQGLVEKTADPEEILRAIHAILRGETLVPLEENLTAREREVVRLLDQGKKTPEIAELLSRSVTTDRKSVV